MKMTDKEGAKKAIIIGIAAMIGWNIAGPIGLGAVALVLLLMD